jgi:hypothetical protein
MLTGGCLCGDVRFEIDGRVTPVELCHCSVCRRANGSAFFAGVACRADRFRWLRGEELIRRFARPSGYTTHFCGVCGSPVPRPAPGEPYTTLPAGSLDGDPGTRLLRHIFVGSKAPWYEIADELPRFETDPPPEQRLPRREQTRG